MGARPIWPRSRGVTQIKARLLIHRTARDGRPVQQLPDHEKTLRAAKPAWERLVALLPRKNRSRLAKKKPGGCPPG